LDSCCFVPLLVFCGAMPGAVLEVLASLLEV
jgi:hypothetical protein